MEKVYTARDLAQMWRFDESTIRRMFIDEPGVMVHGKENRRDGKRQYVSLRIPTSVAERVYKSMLR